MILHTKNRFGFVTESLNGLVVEVDSIHHDITGQGFRVNRETVILGGDFHPPGFEVLHRLIAAAMTEFQFVGPAAENLT